MTPADVCRAIYDAGLSVRVNGDSLSLKPAERLTPDLRALVVAHKPELIQFLLDAEVTAAELVEAAMRCCDRHGDSAQAREDMAKDCANTPAHLRADLRDHFKRAYGGRA